jgi:hypothetical protein
MEKNCGECGSSRFRLSRFRLSDVPRLFAFRYPVRCVLCQKRSYASIPWVLEHRRRRAKRS